MSYLEKLYNRLGYDFFSNSRNFKPLLFKIFTLPFALKIYSLGILAEVNALLLIKCLENAFLLQIEKDCLFLIFFYWNCELNLIVTFDWDKSSVFIIFAKWEFVDILLLFYMRSPFIEDKVSKWIKIRIYYIPNELVFEHLFGDVFSILSFFWFHLIFIQQIFIRIIKYIAYQTFKIIFECKFINLYLNLFKFPK
jgi:hypothetical protein